MSNLRKFFETNEWNLIQEVLSTGRRDDDGNPIQWINLARRHGIKPGGDIDQRRKAANDIWRKYNKKRESISIVPKRLYYDIETSYNIVKSWRVGYNITLGPADIIHERAIICVSYKWEGEDTVHTLIWDNGDDTQLVRDFIEIMAQADELVGHNIDRYDTKFMMTRAIMSDIPALPKYQSYDTLKIAKKHFRFNSNKLDYVAKVIGLDGKIDHEGMPMWDNIVLYDVLGIGNKQDRDASLKQMVEYCEQDVILTEEVFKKLRMYSEHKVHHGVANTDDKHTCPECGMKDVEHVKRYFTKAGNIRHMLRCSNDGVTFTVSNTEYLKKYEETEEQTQ